MRDPPLLRAAAAAGRRHAPAPEQISFGLALDDQDSPLSGDRLRHLWQAVDQSWYALDVPSPFAGAIRVRPLLAEALLAFAVLFQDGGAIRFLVFDALDHKRERAGGVVVAIAPGQRWPRVGAAIV